MLFAAINTGIEFGIGFLPVDEEAKDWMKRGNDGLAIAADVVVGGGTSTAAIVTKAVLREIGDKVVPADDQTAQQVFQAASAVVQTAAGSAGAGVASAAAASGQSATQLAGQAGAQVSESVARQALEDAAVRAAKTAGTQVAGAGIGAGVGYAVDGTAGLQSGVEMGLAVGSDDLSTSGLKLAGSVAGASAGYAAEGGEARDRLAAMRAGASIGTRVGSVGAASTGLGNADLESEVAGLTAQGASAGARIAAREDVADAVINSEGVGSLAASTVQSRSSPESKLEKAVTFTSESAQVALSLKRDFDIKRRRDQLEAVANKKGWSEELVGRAGGIGEEDERIGEATRGLSAVGRATRSSVAAARLGSFRPDQVSAVKRAAGRPI